MYLSSVRIGEPIRHEMLSVFPLFGSSDPVGYALAVDEIASGNICIEEISERGSVSSLSVENRADVRVLFLEGEELIGAKQDRVLNASLLVPAHSRTVIPVSCVERGRWRYRSRHFNSHDRTSSPKLRHLLKMHVSRSARAKKGHRSDQGKVWEEIDRQQATLRTSSPTHAIGDTFDAYQKHIAEYRQNLQYVDGACGLAVAVGKKIVAVDLFDSPHTCQKVWAKLLSGCILDALEAKVESDAAAISDVERLFREVAAMSWEKVESVGVGEEYRAEQGEKIQASALTIGSSPVHVSLLVAM